MYCSEWFTSGGRRIGCRYSSPKDYFGWRLVEVSKYMSEQTPTQASDELYIVCRGPFASYNVCNTDATCT